MTPIIQRSKRLILLRSARRGYYCFAPLPGLPIERTIVAYLALDML
jgi:hypothetical protein